MPRNKTATVAKPKKTSTAERKTAKAAQQHDVLTLAEAAAYLRVPEEDLLRMVSTEALPGRRFGADWRFLKSALQDWLGTPSPIKTYFWEKQFGALKDDPYLDEMLEEIYRQRGRPMTEEG
jgi:excisionase family DNA binding protein